MAEKAIRVTEEQVLYFRARRGHLAGPGAEDATAAARAMLGAQSQQLPPSLLALSARTATRPAATTVERRLLDDEPRTLVRTWGQRDTLHVYDAAAHWADVVAARSEWAGGSRRGGMPPEGLVDEVGALLDERGTVTRADVFPLLPKSYLREVEDMTGVGDAKRFCAGRALWQLANRGDACCAHRIGAEQVYAARTAYFPDLPWPEPDPLAAAARLMRGYLAAYGPATVQDVAHFFGARVGDARRWLAELERDDAVTTVRSAGRDDLLARTEDVDELREKPPAGARGWPLRLLPLWDAKLMGHADKSWTVPDESERPLVWRKAAFVAAPVLTRGRIVATWSQKKTTRLLRVEVTPLSRWRAAHAAGVRREAREVAAHHGLGDVEVTIADG